jgi:hypothetical protein
LPGQSQTLAVLVAAALRCERPNLAQAGRGPRASVGSTEALSGRGTESTSHPCDEPRSLIRPS